jgi:deoxyribodipyrimidine photolyase-related protein
LAGQLSYAKSGSRGTSGEVICLFGIMQEITLVFPHQLYKQHPGIKHGREIVIIEEWLYFRQYAFHKQKLILHRASMKFYEDHLTKLGHTVSYIELSDVREVIPQLVNKGVKAIHYADTIDNWLEKRLATSCKQCGCELNKYDSPNFLSTPVEMQQYLDRKKNYFQTDFYIQQRKNHNILLDARQQPVGGKWSYDADNRLKMPKDEAVPVVEMPGENKYVREAREYIEKNFAGNPGSSGAPFLKMSRTGFYPVTFDEANEWLDQFITNRFAKFGKYQDAMLQHESMLYHGVLTPMLNIGLLQPAQIIEKAVDAVVAGDVPINSAEGFIRQILGWREFMRLVYEQEGSRQRTTNHWGFQRKIPYSFWEGTTGIVPVDAVVKRVLQSGYAHHIERLMVLGNFFLLCEFDPDDVYRWFMELFVDAYDWVMVPNVYGMSQFADGGLMSTKPYISGSNYLFKMGDWKKLKPVGDIIPWNDTWDALFWRFMHVHRDLLSANPRIGMLLKTFDKMPEQKRQHYLTAGARYLEKLETRV